MNNRLLVAIALALILPVNTQAEVIIASKPAKKPTHDYTGAPLKPGKKQLTPDAVRWQLSKQDPNFHEMGLSPEDIQAFDKQYKTKRVRLGDAPTASNVTLIESAPEVLQTNFQTSTYLPSRKDSTQALLQQSRNNQQTKKSAATQTFMSSLGTKKRNYNEFQQQAQNSSVKPFSEKATQAEINATSLTPQENISQQRSSSPQSVTMVETLSSQEPMPISSEPQSISLKKPSRPAPPRPAGPPPSPRSITGIDAQPTPPIKPVKSGKLANTSSSPQSVTMVETLQQPVAMIDAQLTLPVETASQPVENYTHTFDGKVTAYGKSQGHADVNTDVISMATVRQFNNAFRADTTSMTPEYVASQHQQFGTKPGMNIAPKGIQLEMPAPELPSTPKQPEQDAAYAEAVKAANNAKNKAPQKAPQPESQKAKVFEPMPSNLQQSRFQLWKDQIRNLFSKDNIRTSTDSQGVTTIRTYAKGVKINDSTKPISTKVIEKNGTITNYDANNNIISQPASTQKSTPTRSWSLFGTKQ